MRWSASCASRPRSPPQHVPALASGVDRARVPRARRPSGRRAGDFDRQRWGLSAGALTALGRCHEDLFPQRARRASPRPGVGSRSPTRGNGKLAAPVRVERLRHLGGPGDGICPEAIDVHAAEQTLDGAVPQPRTARARSGCLQSALGHLAYRTMYGDVSCSRRRRAIRRLGARGQSRSWRPRRQGAARSQGRCCARAAGAHVGWLDRFAQDFDDRAQVIAFST